MLTSLNRRSENILVEPIVISELKLRDVQRHIFGTDLMITADNSAFEDRPETFNRVRMNGTDNVLMGAVHDRLVRVFGQSFVSGIFIRREKADFVRDGFAHEWQVLLGDGLQNASDNISFAADSANDRRLGFSHVVMAVTPFAVVFVRVLAADESFVHLDNAAKFLNGLDESGADFVAHVQCGFVRAETHHALDLKGANSLLAGEHQVSDFEPVAQWLVRVLEDGPGDVREAITSTLDGLAFVALPLERHGLHLKDVDVAATWAIHAIRPAPRAEINLAGLFIWEESLELRDGHLMDGLRTLGHDNSPYRQEPIWH